MLAPLRSTPHRLRITVSRSLELADINEQGGGQDINHKGPKQQLF